MHNFTDLLYARPSFLEGVARLFDLTGALNEYNAVPTGEEADRQALHFDWYAIGQDAKNVLDRIGREIVSTQG